MRPGRPALLCPEARQAGGGEACLGRFRLGMTLALGGGIPLLSLALSKVAGTLASTSHYALGAFALVLTLPSHARRRPVTWHAHRQDNFIEPRGEARRVNIRPA